MIFLGEERLDLPSRDEFPCAAGFSSRPSRKINGKGAMLSLDLVIPQFINTQ